MIFFGNLALLSLAHKYRRYNFAAKIRVLIICVNRHPGLDPCIQGLQQRERDAVSLGFTGWIPAKIMSE